MNLTEMHRTFHQNTEEYTLCSAANLELSPKLTHIRYKENLNKYMEIVIASYNLFDHNRIKLYTNRYRNHQKLKKQLIETK